MTEAICPLAHRSDPERPRRASYGLLCVGHHHGIHNALADVGEVWGDLGSRLAGGGGSGEGPRPHDDSTGIDLDPYVLESRTVLRTQLVGWARVTLEEGPWQYAPDDEPAAIASWLRQRVDWIEQQPWCTDMVEEITRTVGHAKSLVQPNTVYRIELGPCPESVLVEGDVPTVINCGGTVIAVMRKASAREQLPSHVACTLHGGDQDDPHAWGPMEWHALGRRMGRSLHGSAAEAFMRAVAG